jgi:hypothetical protein
MKKYFIALLACYLGLLQHPAYALLVNLSPKDCEEAITFGKTHRGAIEKELDKRYSFGAANEYSDNGTIHSKWYKLSLMAGYKAQRGEIISRPEQSEILADPFLQININLYGQSLDFAKGYQALLLQDGKEIKANKIHADYFMLQSPTQKTLSGFPVCRAVLRAYFKYDLIDPSGSAVVVIKKDSKSVHLEVDFAKFR